MLIDVVYPHLKQQSAVEIELFDDEKVVTRSFKVSGFNRYIGFPRVGYYINGARDNVKKFEKARGATVNVSSCIFEVTCSPGDLIGDVWHLFVAPAPANDLPDLKTIEKCERSVELLVSYKRVPRTALELPMPNSKSVEMKLDPWSYANLVLDEETPVEEASEAGAESVAEKPHTVSPKQQLPALIAKLEKKYDEATELAQKFQLKMKSIDVAMNDIQNIKEMISGIASASAELSKKVEETAATGTDTINKLEQKLKSFRTVPAELEKSAQVLEDMKAVTIAILDVVD